MIRGIFLTFHTRKPTQDEYNTCTKFKLTYDSPEYEPTDDRYGPMEDLALGLIDHLQKPGDWTQTQYVSSVSWSPLTAWVVAKQASQCNSLLLNLSPTLCEHSFANDLKALVNIQSTQTSWWTLSGVLVTERWHWCCHYSQKLWCWFRYHQTNKD